MAKIIDGKAFAITVRERVAKDVEKLKAEHGITPGLAVVLVGLGVNTLSMTARALSAVAAVLAKVTLPEAQRLAAVALAAPSAIEARAQVRAELPVLDELGL